MTEEQKALEEYHKAKEEAQAACDAFQADLVRVFGKKAGDMRYQPIAKTHPETKDSCARFSVASEKHTKTFQRWLE